MECGVRPKDIDTVYIQGLFYAVNGIGKRPVAIDGGIRVNGRGNDSFA